MDCWDHTPQPHPGEGATPTNLPRRGKTRSGVGMLHWGHKGKRRVLWSGRPGGLEKTGLELHWKQCKAGTQSRDPGVAVSRRTLRLHVDMIPRHPAQ